MNAKRKEVSKLKQYLSFAFAVALLLVGVGAVAQASDVLEMDFHGAYDIEETDPLARLGIELGDEPELIEPAMQMMSSNFSGGSGTLNDPFIITTALELEWLAFYVNTGNANFNNRHYRLESNIDLSTHGQNWNNGQGWIPIGSIMNGQGFRGVFDGNGHVISNLFINRSNNHHPFHSYGLFGYTQGATIKNLGVTNIDIIAYHEVSGGVVAYAGPGTVILNSYTTGSILGGHAGGIAGILVHSTIANSYSNVTVDGRWWWSWAIGGIAGEAVGSVITNTYTTGMISGDQWVGGIVGVTDGFTILDNNVALNCTVRSRHGDVARILGGTWSNNMPILIRNHALSTMTTGGGVPFPTPAITHNVHNGRNGANLNMGQALSRSFWITTTPQFTAWDENIWYIQDGEFPVLKVFEQFPPEDITTVSIPNLDANDGMQVTIPVSIENNPGLALFDFVVRYDPNIMAPVGVEQGAAIPNFFVSSNLNFAPDGVRIMGMDFSSSNFENDGNMVYIIFDIHVTADPGSYPVKVELISFNTFQGFLQIPIDPVTTNNGSVTVLPFLLGDVDGDGFVTMDDAFMVLMYLSGLIDLTPRQRLAADVNQDGVIDMLDVQLIMAMAAAAAQSAPISLSAEVSELAFEEAEVAEPLVVMPQDSNIIAVPISIENNGGLSGFELTLSYDRGRLTPVGFVQGDAWQDLLIFNPDAGDDYVKLIGASIFNDSIDGTIVYVMFEVIGEDVDSIMDYVDLKVEGLTQIEGLNVDYLAGYQVKESRIVFN